MMHLHENILNDDLEKQGEKLKAMKTWCDEIRIDFTPTFFLNGFQLPKQYKIEEGNNYFRKIKKPGRAKLFIAQ